MCMTLLHFCVANNEDTDVYNRNQIFVRNTDLMYAWDSNKGLLAHILRLGSRAKRQSKYIRCCF